MTVLLTRWSGSMANAVKSPTSGYGRATWKCRMPAYSGIGLPIASAPKLANVQFGSSVPHVFSYERWRYSPLIDSPGTISCWRPMVQMRLYSRRKLFRSAVRVGSVIDPKVAFSLAPISQFWATPS